MAAIQPRVQVPLSVARDEVFQVRTVATHPMETGLRQDDGGRIIPRRLLHTFTCRYDDVVVFRADLREAVAANPYLSFHVRASESGRLRFVWEEDGGAVFELESQLTVRP